MDKILKKISEDYQIYSPRQRKVAEYLFQNLNQAILMNSRQIAGEASVSEATVVRFIARLGFRSFTEFKQAVGRKIIEDYSTSKRLVESAEMLNGKSSLFGDILRGDVENLKAMANWISEEMFNKAVEKMCSARTLYILGLRSSYALAFYLAFDLRFFLRSVRVIDLGVDDLPEQLRDIGRSDVLVVISFKRYTRNAVKIAEKIKGKRTFVIAITNSKLSPIAQLSDISLITETKIPSYFESYTAPMSLLNALITAIALREKDKALPMLDKLEKEFQAFETFIK